MRFKFSSFILGGLIQVWHPCHIELPDPFTTDCSVQLYQFARNSYLYFDFQKLFGRIKRGELTDPFTTDSLVQPNFDFSDKRLFIEFQVSD